MNHVHISLILSSSKKYNTVEFVCKMYSRLPKLSIIKIINIIVISLSCFQLSSTFNSICSTTGNQTKCYQDDPDVYLNTIQIIARHGYPAEAHIVTTEDGFLLTLHRIPYNKKNSNGVSGQPIFLQHGLLGCSSDWVLAGANSLAFILSDAGYDVWLGNARGNIYSRSHTIHTPNDPEFWNFSWHEMGYYDLPAVFSFIKQHSNTSKDLLYVGHSMGTTMFFVYSSIYNVSAVKSMVALAPVAYMTSVKSPIRYLAPWANDFEWIAKQLGLNEFLPNNKILKYLADLGCDYSVKEMNLCEDVIFLLSGFDRDEFNLTLLPSVLNHEPAGTSTKTVMHYLQEIASKGDFQQFDYGPEENLKHYGVKKPPLYNLTNINTSLYLMSAQNDYLAAPADVAKLAVILNKTAETYVVPFEKFNHIDFLWGIHAPNLVYSPLMKFIDKFK